jgi:hypothetical protein
LRRGRRPAGTGSQVVFITDEDEELAGVPWSLETYPDPDPKLAPPKDVELLEATERLFWRSDGTLAFRAGAMYPASVADELMTAEELSA